MSRKRIDWLVVLLALVCSLANVPSFADAIDSLGAGQWYEVPNSHLRSVVPQPTPAGDPRNVIDAWSGATFDTKHNRLLVWGGGHNDYAGNEIYAFSLDTLTWSRLTNPSSDVGGVESSGAYPDGNPRSGHSYNTLAYADSSDRLYIAGLSAVWPGGGTPGNFFSFDFPSSHWSQLSRPNNVGDTKGGAAAYDSATGMIWYRSGTSGGLSKLDPVKGSWTSWPDSKYISLYTTAAIDPQRRLFLEVGGYGGQRQINVWDLNNPGAGPTVPNTSGARDLETAASPGLTFDTVSKKFVGWSGGSAVYTLDPANWTWGKAPAAANNTVVPGAAAPTGTFGRFRYIPAKNAFILVNDIDQNVFIYKLSNTTSSSLPTVSLTATPQSVALQGTAALTWSSQNATQCTASGAWSGTKQPQGTQTVGPLAATSSYILTCTNASGATASGVTTVNVPTSGGAIPTLTLSALPTSVSTGATSMLSWSAANATSCNASGGWSGSRPGTGSESTGALTQSTTFSLDCTGSGGVVNKSVQVTVTPSAPAGTLNLTAVPSSVSVGGSATLQWTSTNETSCVASGGWSGTKGTSGTYTAGPLSTNTSFGLTCTGTGGSVQQAANVSVAGPAPGGGSAPTSPSGATLTSVQIASSAAAVQTGVPVTFGEVFKMGDIPSGNTVRASLSDGTQIPLQTDITSRHADGSMRTAVLSLRLPSLAAAATTPIRLAAGTGTPSGTPVQLSELLATSFDAEVGLTLSGVRYAATARSLLTTGAKITQWLSGPVASEWIVGGPVRTTSGTAHPHLTAYFHVRAYRGANGGVDRVRVDAVVENGWTMVPGPGTLDYTAEIKVAGQSVYSRSISHYNHTRWHKQFWWSTAPQVVVKHDTQYLQDTRAVPAFANVHPTDAYLNSLLQSATPMSNGDLSLSFPDTGAQDQIGPLPRWASTYITSGADPRAFRNLLADDDSAGSYSVHYRDEGTGLPVSIADHPTLSLQGNDLPAVSGSNPNSADGAHQPSVGFLSYLLTGDYFYLEEMQFWTSWNHLWANAGYRKGSQGVFGSQVRLQAWSLRNLAQSAYATPDNHRSKAYLVASVGFNIANYASQYSDNPTANQLGAVQSYDGFQLFAPWMDDFLSWSISYVADLGFDTGTVRDWKLKFPVGRMGTTDYCYVNGPAYHLTVGTSNTNWYPDFRTLYSANFGGPVTACPQGQPMIGHPEFVAGYPSNLRPALAAAVDAGIPGAAAAWQRFTTSPIQPDYSDYANWAIVPRGTTGAAPSTPSLTLTASASSVVSGSQATLAWNGSNVTSCVAGQGWTGTKPTTGTQIVGPITTSTTFTLACTGSSGTVNRSVTISVTGTGTAPPPVPTLLLTATPSTVASGGQSSLQWSSTGATSCVASGGWSGAKSTTGTQTFANLTQTLALTLSCTGAGGAVQKSATITVTKGTTTPPAPTLTFKANPTSIASGGQSLLSWSATNASSCVASGAWLAVARSTAGNYSTGSLTKTASYSLSCTGPGGTIQQTVTVMIQTQNSTGGLTGTVDSSLIDPAGTNRVYVFAGSVTPHAPNGTAGDPILSIPVVQDENACTFRYSAPSVPTGSYTIAFAKPGANGSTAFSGAATITAGTAAVSHNFIPGVLLRVGPAQRFKTIRQAAAVAADGTVIEVEAGDYPDDIVVWRHNNVVIRGVGATRPRIRATSLIPYVSGDDLRNGKGLWVVKGSGIRVENFEFSGARVPDRNGAGIRNEGRNLTVCNGYFHNNENGFMGDALGTLTIEHSMFADNGRGDGFTHNVYVGDGGTASDALVFRFNDSSHVSAGHLLKTRARANYVLYNRLMDERDGTSSYNVDVPNGGLTFLIGNLMQQSPNTANSAMIAYGAEGLLSGRTHALYAVNNTLVNDRGSGEFFTVANGTQMFRSVNNLFVGTGTPSSGVQPAAGSNLQTNSPGFVDRSAFDYRLTSQSPAKDVGRQPGNAGTFSLMPTWQYVDPAGGEPRRQNGALDVGAYEFTAQ